MPAGRPPCSSSRSTRRHIPAARCSACRGALQPVDTHYARYMQAEQQLCLPRKTSTPLTAGPPAYEPARWRLPVASCSDGRKEISKNHIKNLPRPTDWVLFEKYIIYFTGKLNKIDTFSRISRERLDRCSIGKLRWIAPIACHIYDPNEDCQEVGGSPPPHLALCALIG